jgi:hypothetical protein
MSYNAAGTLSPQVYPAINMTQNTTALIDSPAFQEFLTGLWSRGIVLLTVSVDQMVPHKYQREVSQEHVEDLADSIRLNNLSYLYPMKGYADYDWDDLVTLPPLAPAPDGLVAHIFDGGHRLAAIKQLNLPTLTTWPVELFSQGKSNSILPKTSWI